MSASHPELFHIGDISQDVNGFSFNSFILFAGVG